MGFYDCRCMVTGVSLKGADAALVTLLPAEKGAQGCQPVTLAIQGAYNRLGSIDLIDEDDHTELVLQFFLEKLAAGDLVVDEEYLAGHEFFPITDIERLLACFERNINDGEHAVFEGQPLVFALISVAVWNAIVAAAPESSPPADPLRAAFGGAALPEALYRDHAERVADQLAEFLAVSAFLQKQGITWRPADNPGQHYSDDMQQYLAEARDRFREVPPILVGLDNYAEEIAELLEPD